MRDVTVILTTYTTERLPYLERSLESLEGRELTVLGVFDRRELAEWFDDRDRADVIVRVDSLSGLAHARNVGAEHAEGDVYAFLDDDVEVHDGWLDALQEAFEAGHVAAGGPACPDWPHGRPRWLAPQWDWLVGCGPYLGAQEVRNSYGCNLAVDAGAFDELGGFDVQYGKKGNLDQGEEAEFCRRLAEHTGQGVWFDPKMAVRHEVFDEQTRYAHLLRRSYAQGRSKARMGIDETETGFLRDAIAGLRHQRATEAIGSLSWLAAVGAGYIIGKTF